MIIRRRGSFSAEHGSTIQIAGVRIAQVLIYLFEWHHGTSKKQKRATASPGALYQVGNEGPRMRQKPPNPPNFQRTSLALIFPRWRQYYRLLTILTQCDKLVYI